jgi:hypothetical protein
VDRDLTAFISQYERQGAGELGLNKQLVEG